MAEINNNIQKFGINSEKIDKKKNPIKEETRKPTDTEKGQESAYVPDTGVLGRSQVKRTRGGDISKSVDEAVSLATKHPEILAGSEKLFDCLYADYLQSGMDPSDAYMKALLAEAEFMEISTALNR